MSQTFKKHAGAAGLSLLLATSPVGAPAVGALIATACPEDATVTPDGPFALSYSYCGFDRSIEHAYQSAMFLPVIVGAGTGPLIGGVIAVVWALIAFSLPIAVIWNVARAALTLWRQSDEDSFQP